jgi:hypothetical protein
VVRDGDVRVEREGELALERAGAHRALQPVAGGPALLDADEHHRRHRPERVGAGEDDLEPDGALPDLLEVVGDAVERDALHARRRQQREVGRDGAGQRVAEALPSALQELRPRRRDLHGDADR